MQNLYSEKYITNDVELDVNEKLSVIEILKLMQRVTFSHSQLIGLDHQTMIDRDNAFWVITKIKVVYGSGATADLALLYECKAIIRVLRGLSDYDYEVQIQQVNKEISNGQINTVCLFADRDYQFISSSIVKEIFLLIIYLKLIMNS